MRVARIWIIIAERTKSILAQRSFRFFKTLANGTLANGTLAKRRVDETTVHPKIEQAKERLCWQGALSNDASYLELSSGAHNDNFRQNTCSEDDLRSRIFGTFVVKFLGCLLLLGFSNI